MKIFQIRRRTLETDIELKINFIGNGFYKIKTFNYFLDHLISQLLNYGKLDVNLSCFSDIKCDLHHNLEDLGIVLGTILNKFEKKRYNTYCISMDDSYIIMTIDFCKRIFYNDNLEFYDYDFQLIKEFFSSFVKKAKCNLQIYILKFYNKHHLIECLFKLLGIIINCSKKNEIYVSTKGI